jgi:hypothetical protein
MTTTTTIEASGLRAEVTRWSPSLLIGVALLALIVLAGLLAPWLTP